MRIYQFSYNYDSRQIFPHAIQNVKEDIHEKAIAFKDLVNLGKATRIAIANSNLSLKTILPGPNIQSLEAEFLIYAMLKKIAFFLYMLKAMDQASKTNNDQLLGLLVSLSIVQYNEDMVQLQKRFCEINEP